MTRAARIGGAARRVLAVLALLAAHAHDAAAQGGAPRDGTPPVRAQPPAATGQPQGGTSPLALEDVRRSVLRHYPLLAAAAREFDIAEGKLRSARGGFDLKLGAEAKFIPEGDYENEQGEVKIEQPTTLWGARLFSGYRIGRGDYPDYYGDRQTYGAGEYSAGVEVPLLRGGAVDSRRTKLAQAEIDREIAAPAVARQTVEFLRAASRSYWTWVAAGSKVDVGRRLLDLARTRNAAIARRVEKGAAPVIDLTDNERLIVDREVKLVAAERYLQASAIDLSLYVRDDDGNPSQPRAESLPPAFPAPEPPRPGALDADTQAALAANPDLRRLDLQRERLDADAQLANNELLPGLDVTLAGSQDFGEETKKADKGDFELQAKLRLDVPLQRRDARGRLDTARAQLAQLDAQRRYARESIAARVRDGLSALEAAYRQLGQARRNVELARQLEDGERKKFDLGGSSLINVNIRELQAADAAATEIDAHAEYFRAAADYRAAMAADAGISTP